ncbi:MAG: class I SAM-dependent methyltransferase, partial [Croceibacterium sp.]
MTDASDWKGRSGESWAAEWRRTDRGFAPLTERLLLRSRQFDFSQALDVGCGAGELSLALGRGRPYVEVVGVDISQSLIDAARTRGTNLANVSFALGDAAHWRPADGFAPDLLISRHGVMFFSDPVAAFGHLAEIAAPGASLLFSCFREPSENPFFTEIGKLLPAVEASSGDEPGPFAFADQARVARLLGEAGWIGIEFEPFDFAMVAGAGTDPIGDAAAYFTRIGPAARALTQLPPEGRE